MSVITLVGPNSFLIDLEVRRFLDKSETAVEWLDGNEISADDVIFRLNATSLFAAKQLIIIKNVGKSPLNIEFWQQWLDHPPTGTDLLLIDSKLDKRSKLYQLFKKNTVYKELNEIKGPGLINWLISYTIEKGGQIKRQDAEYLVSKTVSSQQQLAMEIDKLLIYDQTISAKTIDLLVEASPESEAFRLIGALLNRNKVEINRLYLELRADGKDPNELVGLIAWQLHMLAAAITGPSPGQIAADLSANPNAVNNSLAAVRKITLQDLIAAVNRLLTIDYKMKQQAINGDDALLYFLLSF